MKPSWNDPIVGEFARAVADAYGPAYARHFRIAPVGRMFRVERIIKAAYNAGGQRVEKPLHRDYTPEALRKYIDRLRTYERRERNTSPLGW